MPEGIHRDMADMKKILIGAHRGAMCHAPENSLAAFEKAIDFGTYRIECDIRQTKDGHLVMMHDTSVDRTTDGTGAVAEMSLENLKRLRLGSENVPTLAESLTCVKGRCLMLLFIAVTRSTSNAKKCFRRNRRRQAALPCPKRVSRSSRTGFAKARKTTNR